MHAGYEINDKYAVKIAIDSTIYSYYLYICSCSARCASPTGGALKELARLCHDG